MNYDELNNFIKHYIENDKTQRAIMLNGDWGSGKSHYIQNELIPFLSKEENGNYQCIKYVFPVQNTMLFEYESYFNLVVIHHPVGQGISKRHFCKLKFNSITNRYWVPKTDYQ